MCPHAVEVALDTDGMGTVSAGTEASGAPIGGQAGGWLMMQLSGYTQ